MIVNYFYDKDISYYVLSVVLIDLNRKTCISLNRTNRLLCVNSAMMKYWFFEQCVIKFSDNELFLPWI